LGKNRRGEKEYSREQKLIHENKRLKRQVDSLRKQLARLDLDRYSQVRDVLEAHYAEDNEQNSADLLDRLKHEWACRECGKGNLEIILYTKASEPWYFRRCNLCEHRTKSQQYHPSVKGIVKTSSK
jgi:hypothetical protein